MSAKSACEMLKTDLANPCSSLYSNCVSRYPISEETKLNEIGTPLIGILFASST